MSMFKGPPTFLMSINPNWDASHLLPPRDPEPLLGPGPLLLGPGPLLGPGYREN